MKILYASFLIGLLLVGKLMAFDFEESNFMLPGESEASGKLFLKIEKRSLMLPPHLQYKSKISNNKNTLAVINFHGMSNYDGIDLIASTQSGKIIVIPNIWNLIKLDLVDNKIIPTADFDHIYFEVIKIDEDKLFCTLYAASAKTQTEITEKFDLLCQITPNSISFKVQRK